MSRAFVKEEQPEAPLVVPPRAPLPDGAKNYVTARGLELLREECDALALALESARVESTLEGEERARTLAMLTQRKALVDERIATAIPVPVPEARDEVRFGATVTVQSESGGLRRYRIVGVDEANPSEGSIAFVSPLARALLGKRAGDVATVPTPRGEEVLEVALIEYPAP